ncbi:MAG: type I 3-dehydroquinate dehydratase [Thermodesulfovibrionales bacterium]|nr:type I 3-dehydroquinate dehydratase [Thermodesulfovibrionales bacterium]
MKIGEIALGNIPVVVGTVSGNLNLSTEIVDKVDIFEIRIDRFKSQEINSILKFIESLKQTYGKPLIATVRSLEEGGAISIDDNKRFEIFKEIAPFVDSIDIELSSPNLLKRIRSLCKEKLLIASYHNHAKTPEDDMLMTLITDAKAYGADVIKIAVMAKNKEDLSKLILFTIKNKDKGLITISLGSIGSISRIINPIIGSLMTYGYIDTPSSSGQLSVFDIVEYLRLFDPKYNEFLINRARLFEFV